MLKKLNFLAFIAVLAAISGCSSTKKDNTLRGVQLKPKAHATPVVADLKVANEKVLGQAKGKTIFKKELEQEAVAEALKKKRDSADVLVGANFFYEEVNKTELTVTVVGYPARYKNFRPKEPEKPKEADVLLEGNFYYKDGANNNLQVTVKNTTPESKPSQEPAAAQEQPQTLAPAAPAAPAIPAASPQEE